MLSKKVIDAEIKKLVKLRPQIVPRSMFGEDNIAKIDVCLKVLRNNLAEDQICDEWNPDEAPEVETKNQYLQSIAMDTRRWMDGEEEIEAPSEGWPLKK